MRSAGSTMGPMSSEVPEDDEEGGRGGAPTSSLSDNEVRPGQESDDDGVHSLASLAKQMAKSLEDDYDSDNVQLSRRTMFA